MKNSIIIIFGMLLVSLVFIFGYVRITEKSTGGEPLPEIVFTGSGYEGEAEVGNEIMVTFIVKPYNDRSSNLFYLVDWDNIEIIPYEIIENEPYSIALDLFDINSSRIEVIKKEKEVNVKVPIKILRDGKGFVSLEIHDESFNIGKGVDIETAGYIPPEKPPLPDYCKNLTAEEGEKIGCAIEVR